MRLYITLVKVKALMSRVPEQIHALMGVNNYDHATIEYGSNCPEPVISLNPDTINCAEIQVCLKCLRDRANVPACPYKAAKGLAQLLFHVHYAPLAQNAVFTVFTLAQKLYNLLPDVF